MLLFKLSCFFDIFTSSAPGVSHFNPINMKIACLLAIKLLILTFLMSFF